MATARLARAGAAPTQRKSESRSRMAWKCTRCSPSCPLKSCRAMPPAAPPPPAASIAASPGAARPEHARPERQAGPGSREAAFAPPRRRHRPGTGPARPPPRPAAWGGTLPAPPGNAQTCARCRHPAPCPPLPSLPSVRAQTPPARTRAPGCSPPGARLLRAPYLLNLHCPLSVHSPSASHSSSPIPKDTGTSPVCGNTPAAPVGTRSVHCCQGFTAAQGSRLPRAHTSPGFAPLPARERRKRRSRRDGEAPLGGRGTPACKRAPGQRWLRAGSREEPRGFRLKGKEWRGALQPREGGGRSRRPWLPSAAEVFSIGELQSD